MRGCFRIRAAASTGDELAEGFPLMTYCGSRGIRIPKHLSVSLADAFRSHEWMVSGPSLFSFNPKFEVGVFCKSARRGMPQMGNFFHKPDIADTGTVLNLRVS